MRRSTRVSVAILIRVRAVEPTVQYAEECQTLLVNAHGCGFRSPRPLPIGTRVEVEVPSSGRRGSGSVLNCSPLSNEAWLIGLQMEVPANIWGLRPMPADWPAEPASGDTQAAGSTAVIAHDGRLRFSPFASSRAPKVRPAAGVAVAPTPAAAPDASPAPEEQARQLTAGLAREAEAAMARLRQFVEESTRHNAEGVASVLAESKAEISRHIEKASQEATAGLQERIRADLEKERQQLRKMGEALHSETEQVEKERRRLAAELEEVRKKREQLETLVQQLPETIEAQVGARAAALLEQIRGKAQDVTAAGIAGQLQVAQTRLRTAAEDVKGKLEKSAGAQNQAMQAAYDSARKELQQLHARTESLVSNVHSELQAKTKEAVRAFVQQNLKQSLAELTQAGAATRDAAKVRPELDRLLADVSARSEQSARQLQEAAAALEKQRRSAEQAVQESVKRAQQEVSQSAAAAGQKNLAQVRAEMDRLLAGVVERQEHAAREMQHVLQSLEQQKQTAGQAGQEVLEKARKEIEEAVAAAREKHLAQVQAELDRLLAGAAERGEKAARQMQEATAALEKQRQSTAQAAQETIKTAERQLVQAATAAREAHLAQVQEQLDRLVKGVVDRGEQMFRELQKLLEDLRKEKQTGDAQSAALRQQIELAQVWLADELQKFKTQVHDACVEAGGEIKGRLHAAIEAAGGSLQRHTEELQLQVGKSMDLRQTELLEQARVSLLSAGAEAQKEADESLQQRLAQTLESFQQDAEKLARSSLERWHKALQESCNAIPDVLRRALDPEK